MWNAQSVGKYIEGTFLKTRVKNSTGHTSAEYFIFAGTIISLFVITLFLFFIIWEALPVFKSEGFGFITGTVWNYTTNQYGILIFIVSTIAITVVTMLLACPLSLLTAIFLAEFAPARVSNIIMPMVELLIGIPSIVYGLFGLSFLYYFVQFDIKPFIGSTLGFIPIFANGSPNTGQSLLLASLILTVMVLPTITILSLEAMRSVPREYIDASNALGATKWETIKKVIIPTAKPGIIAGILLGLMRAMGETMAVVMLTGNTFQMPTSILDTGYAMTSKILMDITFYYGIPSGRSALMGIALVLFVMEFLILVLVKAMGARFK
jgi:phosphate transport system permease protein